MKIDKKIIYRILKILLVIFILICISFTNGRNRKVTFFESAFNKVLLIPQKLTHLFNSSILKSEVSLEIEKIKNENNQLKDEIQKMKVELTDVEITKSENKELKNTMNVKAYYDDKNVVVANVVGSDVNNWDELIIIDKGYKDGISPNCAVITKEGLVGYVMTCSDNSSKIVTILDATSTFSARATETREEVIVKGDVALKSLNEVKLEQIPIGITYKSGDKIETSGIGGIYPKGITVGDVIAFEKGINPLENTAIVKTSVDFDRLELVAVIVDN